ncbi:MAG: hypothetical protein HG467_001480 [Clostridiales bacterium]|nr:hypothetical protein [Clostridiales bacterium]
MDKRRNEELLNSVANSIKSDKKVDISEKYGLSSALKSLLEEQNALNKQDETRVKKEEIKFVKLNEEEKDKKEVSETKKEEVKVKEDIKPNISVEKMKEMVEESKKSGDDVLKKQIDSILSSYKDTDEDKSKENLNKEQKEQIVVELDENKAVTYKFKKLEVSDKQKAAIDQFFGVSEEMEKRRKKDDKILSKYAAKEEENLVKKIYEDEELEKEENKENKENSNLIENEKIKEDTGSTLDEIIKGKEIDGEIEVRKNKTKLEKEFEKYKETLPEDIKNKVNSSINISELAKIRELKLKQELEEKSKLDVELPYLESELSEIETEEYGEVSDIIDEMYEEQDKMKRKSNVLFRIINSSRNYNNSSSISICNIKITKSTIIR